MDEPKCQMTKQRSKSEIETIYQINPYYDPQAQVQVQVQTQKNKDVLDEGRKDGSSLESSSFKNISQYQGKTMASINKFHNEDRDTSCKSVLHKHKFGALQS